MSGVLYLIPNTLGEGDADALAHVLPEPVRAQAAALAYYIGENAKTTRAFLKKVGTQRPIQEIDVRELNVNTLPADIDKLLAPILAGTDAGLVSEAGCPAVADPGALLVRRAHQRGVKVVPFVGPSSILLALMASGMNGQRFAFHGYLPVKPDARATAVRRLEQSSRPPRSRSTSLAACRAWSPRSRSFGRSARRGESSGVQPQMKRATATYGSWLYCSKNIHASVCARCHASPAKYCVPSASQHRIAFDSTMMRPSSSSIIGTLPFGFLARYSGVRVAPCALSVSIQR